MAKNNEDFRDKLKTLAQISDLIENENYFNGGETEVNFLLEKEKYDKILRNFREIDWNSKSFLIKIGEVNFRFVLKK